jgi:hypothetical protein
MFRLDIRSAASYAAALTVTLVSTAMLFAAAAVPSVSGLTGVAA